MDRVRKLIHAEREDVSPYTGAGVTVAILDTGIAMHPDFADRVIGFRDFVGTSRMPYDDCGHGTHVAGCLCGAAPAPADYMPVSHPDAGFCRERSWMKRATVPFRIWRPELNGSWITRSFIK